MTVTNHANKIERLFGVVKPWPYLVGFVGETYRKSLSVRGWTSEGFFWPHEMEIQALGEDSTDPGRSLEGYGTVYDLLSRNHKPTRSRIYHVLKWCFAKGDARVYFEIGGATQPVEQVFSMHIYEEDEDGDIRTRRKVRHQEGKFADDYVWGWHHDLRYATGKRSPRPRRTFRDCLDGKRDDPMLPTTGSSDACL